ncbi:sensor histidine kinase [Ancylobacter rudongensis]|uniref:histidine kinase n=1 Tax=Ancylobacter rudongensis TaxID=177413 RepID=A0A1G4UMJ4_9HYPH|nr:ATP-binding protein [Ancylobacter rudongensis]SCW94727.1 His Kinase A (phospho-acceptor) domain-containing protein [Ancylobacter rudongensis]
MISSRNKRSLGLLKLGLVVASVALFLATALVYVSQTRQQAFLTATIRSSGWVAYQAQLEFVRAQAEFAKLAIVPSALGIDKLMLRLEILRSRLPLLYDSDEGRVLSDVVDTRGPTQIFEARLDQIIDDVARLDPEDGDTAAQLRELSTELEPLGEALQTILMESVAYNQEIFRRERALAQRPGATPLLLLFISGACLAAVLILQSRRDRIRMGEIVEAQATLAAVEENLRAVIQAVPACVVVIDPDTDHVSFFNPSAADLVSPSLDDPAWPRFVNAVRVAAGEPDTSRWGALTMGYARSPGDIVSLRGSVGSVLWERRQQQLIVLVDTSRVRNAELQVMQAAKLATLGEMATAIAHELNQPLAVIKMAVANARRLLDPLPGGEPVAAKLERISAQVDRAKRITDQVRRYGRMPTEQLLPFSLRHAVELAAGFVAEQFRAANIRLSIETSAPAELLVFGEQTMFEQVIVNLLINARDAYETQDEDRPEAAHHEGGAGDRQSGAGEREVQVAIRLENARAVVLVQDNAGGVPPEMLERLFEPFATTKPTEKGTGLGLSLARSVIRDMNGTIVAENSGGGARFVINLPTSHALAAQDAA